MLLALQAIAALAADDAVLTTVRVTAPPVAAEQTLAAGLPLAPRDTPQATTTLDRAALDAAGAVSLDELERLDAGISRSRNQFFARGRPVANLMVDGLAFGHDATLGLGLDLVLVDHIDIVRGAAGLAQGSGHPSALIGLTRKAPTATPRRELALTLGSRAQRDAVIDLAGPLFAPDTGAPAAATDASPSPAAAGRAPLRGRLIAGWREQDGWQERVAARRQFLYGVLEADLGRDTRLSLGGSWQQDDSDDSYTGIPTAPDGSDLKLPRRTYLGTAWDYREQRAAAVFATLEHRFASGWRVRADTARHDTRLDYLGTYLSGWLTPALPTIMNLSLGQYAYRHRQESHAIRLDGPFRWLGGEHELSLGLTRRVTRTHGDGRTVVPFVLGIDVRNWDWRSLPKPDLDALPAYRYSPDTRTVQNGAWLAAGLSLAPTLKLILGLRAEEWSQRSAVRDSFTTLAAADAVRHLGHYAGLVWELDARHRLYLSHGDIFQPQAQRTVSGDFLRPAEGRVAEAGLKADYLDGALSAQVALFRSEQKNAAEVLENQVILCPSFPAAACYRAVERVQARGVEASLSGALTPDWRLTLGYADTDSRQSAGPNLGQSAGERFDTQLPQRRFTLATRYRLPGGRWHVGGRLAWQSAIEKRGYDWLTATDHHIRQPAYALAGLTLGWRAGADLDVQLDIDNLTDRRYYQSIESPTFTTDGAPRTLRLTARYRF